MIPESIQPIWLRAVFAVSVSLLLTHELINVASSTFFFQLTGLSSEILRLSIVVLHMPIIATILVWLIGKLPRRLDSSKSWVAVLLILHAGLHLADSTYSVYGFNEVLSDALIAGSSICSFIYLWCRQLLHSRRGLSA